jgi:hypothetical protein
MLMINEHTYIPLTLDPKPIDLAMRNTADVTGGKPMAVWLQFISGKNAVNLSVTFYDIHGRKGEALFFCYVPDTTLGNKCNLIWFPGLGINVKKIISIYL